jgi:NAD(P)-dependent dehydrogenase (short-subunit alcohol dehydrogenase family)
MLQEKVCIVTGAGRGLGAAICEVLAAAGCNVVAADVQENAAHRIAEKLRGRGRGFLLDVTNEQQAGEVINRVISHFGRIDVLVNNAGVDRTVSVEEMSMQDWDRILSVNLRGPFIMSKLVLPAMKRSGSGHIVNIVSTAAKRAWANASAYHASKWGLLGLSHALHVEARPNNIKVTAVIAGGMRTPFLLDRFPELDPGVLQDPKNVAETVKFVLMQPEETVVPEVMVLPMRETSWP